MQKGLAIAAFVLSIISIFVPFIGTWLTILVGFLAAFGYGQAVGFATASIIINITHILFLSPLLWAATQGLAELSMTHSGERVLYIPWLLIGIQVFSACLLYFLHNGHKETINPPF